ncbi:MAG: hypothetical protein M9894_15245 [Planctomycetes bacterium]|nr:hypothetical protein [Planctomycetota bacterium]MCO5167701.1 hypothetical protein [Planctomycetota bacterium]MCW8139444.1 hypothetical protein [Planctomycetota bacterium]
MASKLNHVAPQCLALVLCDAVIEDVRSRNKSLINMFNGILSSTVPVRHDKMCAFAAFTGGRGPVPIALRLCYDPEYENDLLRLGGVVDFPADNPQAVVDLVFEIRGFVFPHFGQYTFEVICDDVPIMARRFTISKTAAALKEPELELE